MNTFLKYEEFLIERNYTEEDLLLLEKSWDKDVSSSHLKNLKYDNKTKTLEIEFLNGSVYQYEDVPEKVFRELADEQNILRKLGSKIVKKTKNLFNKREEKEGTYGTRFWELIRRKDYKFKKIK